MTNLIVVSGPTASGKSYMAEILSKKYDSAIINADSMQVYKELPILTSQPNFQDKKYKLYSVFDYKTSCSVGKWVLLAKKEIAETFSKKKKAIVVGGTGLYLKALIYGIADIPDISQDIRNEVRGLFQKLGKEEFFKYLCNKDSKTIELIKSSDSQRMIRALEVLEQTGKSIIEFKHSIDKSYYEGHIHINLCPERKFLYENCNSRFEKMLSSGAVEEVKSFKEKIYLDRKDYLITKAIGFREISEYLDGNLSLEDVSNKIKQATRNYAKRQLTWFRHQIFKKVCIEYESIIELHKSINKHFAI